MTMPVVAPLLRFAGAAAFAAGCAAFAGAALSSSKREADAGVAFWAAALSFGVAESFTPFRSMTSESSSLASTGRFTTGAAGRGVDVTAGGKGVLTMGGVLGIEPRPDWARAAISFNDWRLPPGGMDPLRPPSPE